MPENVGYFRLPSIAGNAIVFITEDDLWTVPRAGGVARRLTANLGPVIGRAMVSPDGAWIAYTGTEEANAEVYVMPAEGGSSQRLTYLGANTAVRGWSPDGRIIFMSDAGRANRADWQMYTIAPSGGVPERLPVGPATELAYAPDGKGIVLGRQTVDPARWKRYRGGTRGDIWIDVNGDGIFNRLLDAGGNHASPLWVGRRIYFLSDHEGIGNLYSCTPAGTDLRRHTDHDTYYARWAATDGRRIVYQLAAEIWLFDPNAGNSRRVDVDLRSPRIQRNRRFVDAGRYLHGVDVHPEGHSLVMNARGKLHTMPLWERAVRQYGKRDGVRYRLSCWTFDGASIVTTSDASGEEALEIHSTEDPTRVRRLDGLDLGRAIELAPSPVANEVAIANHRNELVWVNLRNGQLKVLDRSTHGRITGPVWSPDGRFIAYSCPTTVRTVSIKLAEPANGRTQVITRPDFFDYAPAFDPDGKYLYFLSRRVFDPVFDAFYVTFGFPRGGRPHLVTLQAGQPSPFVATPKGLAGPKPPDKPPDVANAKPGDKPKKPEVRIDFDGIDGRVVAFPMPEGRYAQIHGLPGKVLVSSFPVLGALGDDIFNFDAPARGKLESYDLEELKLETLIPAMSGFAVSLDNKTLVYSAGPRLRAIRAGAKPDSATERESPSRTSGWIDLSRVRVSVDPGSEWHQMYREAWRFQREHFWVPDLSGVDWDAIYLRYLPLVDKVCSRLEFSDLMWEMQGELGTSHAYEMGGDVKAPPPYPVGHLACDVSLRDGRWTIEHIVRGDSWDPDRTSPLAAAGVDVTEGSTILAVNGQPTTPDTPPQSLLVNQAGVNVDVLVGDARGRNARTVVVKTLRAQGPARYREWVETNRRHVHDATGGRVGYVHIPDMGANGYSEFHRYYLSEVERDGLVVDVRFNAGGFVSQMIIEKLARDRVGYVVTRWSSEPRPYPADSPAGPLVCITNELAGSDGDIFTHVFKMRGLGPVVGKRTWGGVVGISLRNVMVDNSVTTQPEFAHWFSDVGWSVENYGTDPTHEVDITPQDHAAGRDPQMETALDLIREALEKYEPLRPDLSTRRMLTLPTLPPRRKALPPAGGKRRR